MMLSARFLSTRAPAPAPMSGSTVSVLVPVPLDGPFDYRLAEGRAAGGGDVRGGAVRRPRAGRRRLGRAAGPRVGGAPAQAARRRSRRPAHAAGGSRPAERGRERDAGAARGGAQARPERPCRARALAGQAGLPSVRGSHARAPAPLPRRRAGGPPRRPALPAPALAKAAGVGTGVVQAMVRDGLLFAVPILDRPSWRRPDPDRGGVELTPRQRAAADKLCRLVEGGTGVALLDGVPGAGKTEVYFEAVAAALRAAGGCWCCCPRSRSRPNGWPASSAASAPRPAVWHSALTSAQRRRTWRLIAEGAVDVVVGARSALFLPLRELGLIVVDEEHDASFKQEETVHYHARDMALARARLEGCAVVLASATPSLEIRGRRRHRPGGPPPLPGWHHVALPGRHGGARMPDVRLVDLRRERPPRGGFLSPPCARRWPATSPTAHNRCCSSIAAATPRSPCAAPAAIAWPARTARPGWWRTVCAAGCNAIIAATRCRCPNTARAAVPWACSPPPARASNAWPRNWASCCPGPASR